MPDPARWLNANIPGWRGLQQKEKKAIRDFAVLWSFFELNSTWRYGRPNASPVNIIRAVDELEEVPNSGRLIGATDHFAQRYLDGGGFTERWSHLRMKNECFEMVRNGLLGADRTSSQTLLALLLIINRLRNNFLHGEKARYDFADQYDNFAHANTVLIFALELWPSPQEN